MKQKVLSGLAIATLVSSAAIAQQPDIPTTNKMGSKYQFTIVKDNNATSVKNQYHSETCWCFSTQSFLESELMRMGKGTYSLSQMFVIHNMYLLKAINYMRYTGKANFGPGGEPHDVLNAVKLYGIVPSSAYRGMPESMDKPDFVEMDAVLKGMLDAMLKSAETAGHLNPNWFAAFEGALDGYMGKVPTDFTYEGKSYTPMSFAKYLGINPDDYVELTSFTHHPFYTKFALEVEDNFEHAEVYNLPLDEFKKVADNALMNGYTMAWGADVSEPYCDLKRSSLAVVPQQEMGSMSSSQKDSIFLSPITEKKITQETRQQAFDDLSTTDDHGMQITGIAKDQNGDGFYIVKNSWGTGNYCKGYDYVSQQYFLYKTTSIMVNKNAIPADIRKQLGI